jgi:hypothetical protein
MLHHRPVLTLSQGLDIDIDEHGRVIRRRLVRTPDARINVPIRREVLVLGSAPQAMSLDPSADDQLVILFGGTGGGGPRNDTWKFNGTTWAECMTECPVASLPATRGGPEMEFDTVLGETVMFGGQSGSGFL